jgi:6-phosphofructokinase 1
VSQIGEELGYPVVCVGIPKTVDNDLPVTDNCPGFGSVAKYVATSIREAAFDVASMAKTSTKIFVMEVMGRHAGWITAACGLAAEKEGDGPHILLFPEVPFDEAAFLARVKSCVEKYDHCVIGVSEGLLSPEGQLMAEAGGKDAFGHSQLGGVGQLIAQLIKDKLGYKYHWALADYLQRSARHIASATDVEQAYAVGKAAVELALAGRNAVMPAILRTSNAPYRWEVGTALLKDVANVEKMMPKDFITPDGFGITDACREYLSPLISGEAPPPYRNGLPDYVRLMNQGVAKKLPEFKV